MSILLKSQKNNYRVIKVKLFRAAPATRLTSHPSVSGVSQVCLVDYTNARAATPLRRPHLPCLKMQNARQPAMNLRKRRTKI